MFLLSKIKYCNDLMEETAMGYKISFWNYEKTGKIEPKHAVKDWKDAGINLAMTFEYDSLTDSSDLMSALLDECEKNEIKVILCDKRYRYETYALLGEKAFREQVKLAIKEFGNHPSVYGYHVGDEPTKDSWANAKEAFKIVQEEGVGKKAFINMWPTWTTPDFDELLGTNIDGFFKKIEEFIIYTKAEILSFDCYSQCAYSDKANGIDNFIRNLQRYYEVAKKTGVELFVSLLSVGHWNMRVPTQDDVRWQMNVSAAHGATGLFWFYFYQRHLEDNYREGPINCFGEKTDAFNKISFQDRLFMEYYAGALEGLTLDYVSYYNGAYANGKKFEPNAELKLLQTEVNECPICVTRWLDKGGKVKYTFVNMSQEMPTRLVMNFEGELSVRNGKRWLAPGQLLFVDAERFI